MESAPLPLDESARLAALRNYAVLDTDAESAFDALTEIAADLFGTPIALVSLVDENRQWFKSHHGLDVRKTPRDPAFCAHAILSEQPLVIPDTLEDPRFLDNPVVVNPPHIRFYAGAPLIDGEGHRLGTLCVIDRDPRSPSKKQLRQLRVLATQVTQLLELRQSARQLAEALERVRVLSDLIPICSYCKKVRNDQDYWESVEHYVASRTGAEFTHGICPNCLTSHFGDGQAD